MIDRDVTESVVEQPTLACLEGKGWSVLGGADVSPSEQLAEREGSGEAARNTDAVRGV